LNADFGLLLSLLNLYSGVAMLLGLLMLLGPIVVFIISLPFSRRLKASLRKSYWVIGGLVVFCGSGTSVYFAAYSGDQGGIAAYFFQITVIVIYVFFSAFLLILNRLSCGEPPGKVLKSLAIVIIGLLAVWLFPVLLQHLKIDRCLDSGGAYDYTRQECRPPSTAITSPSSG
jgi:hypothetical protein